MDDPRAAYQSGPILGQRACARPDGCCVAGPPAGWCAALRASLVATADGGWLLPATRCQLGALVMTPAGPGRVSRVRLSDGAVTVALEAGGQIDLAAAAVVAVEP